MRLKTFAAPTATLAMAQVRAALGDEAIIVATREDGGEVRVTAALDAPSLPPPPAPPVDAGSADTVADTVFEALRRHGLPAVLTETLIASVEGSGKRDPAEALTVAIADVYRFRPLEPTSRRPARMLVGPPGAGKTQTVAKLAAEALTRGQRVALFTTDSERAGGDARLAGLAAAMGLPLMTVEDPDTLAAGLIGMEGSDMVLIDTAGANHLDVPELERLSRYLLCGEIEAVLVVPAGIDPMEAGDLARVFGELGVGRMVSTRHDMTRRMGSALTAADAGPLAFSAFSNTPRIKDGLIPAEPAALARIILRGGAAAKTSKTGA